MMNCDAHVRRPARSPRSPSSPTASSWTLIFIRDLRHPPDEVWAALTDPEQLPAWAPYTADRHLGRGRRRRP